MEAIQRRSEGDGTLVGDGGEMSRGAMRAKEGHIAASSSGMNSRSDQSARTEATTCAYAAASTTGGLDGVGGTGGPVRHGRQVGGRYPEFLAMRAAALEQPGQVAEDVDLALLRGPDDAEQRRPAMSAFGAAGEQRCVPQLGVALELALRFALPTAWGQGVDGHVYVFAMSEDPNPSDPTEVSGLPSRLYRAVLAD